MKIAAINHRSQSSSSPAPFHSPASVFLSLRPGFSCAHSSLSSGYFSLPSWNRLCIWAHETGSISISSLLSSRRGPYSLAPPLCKQPTPLFPAPVPEPLTLPPACSKPEPCVFGRVSGLPSLAPPCSPSSSPTPYATCQAFCYSAQAQVLLVRFPSSSLCPHSPPTPLPVP